MPRAALAPVLAGDPDASLGDDGLGDLSGGAEEDVDRRSFGGLAAGAVAGLMLPEVTVPARVTAANIRYLRACADSLYSRDQAVGGGVLLSQAVRHWRHSQRMLDESDYSEAVGRDLLRVTGSLAVCAGWLAFDGGNLPLARRLYGEARLLTDGAGDPLLSVHVLEKLSMLSAFRARTGQSRGPAREAAALAERAAEEARSVSLPRVRALVALRRASAVSLLGDRAGFQRAVADARRELDRGVSGDDPEWAKFVDEYEVKGQEGMGYLNLGEAETSAALHRATLEPPDLAVRNRLCARAHLANALISEGDVTGAVGEATEALSALEGGVTCIRALNELRPVRDAVGKGSAEEFCVRYDALQRVLTA
ncbi:MAG TPA: hypothetical protein VGS19_15670, partial [Streptosporangiaceae bacterium]|nr:hypothetical protein [Streptosporangiaceae bacterium]